MSGLPCLTIIPVYVYRLVIVHLHEHVCGHLDFGRGLVRDNQRRVGGKQEEEGSEKERGGIS